MTIPARFEAAVAEVNATYSAFVRCFAKGAAPALNNRRDHVLLGLMTALGLDRKSHPARITLDELTDEQREAWVALTDGPAIELRSVAALPPTVAHASMVGPPSAGEDRPSRGGRPGTRQPSAPRSVIASSPPRCDQTCW